KQPLRTDQEKTFERILRTAHDPVPPVHPISANLATYAALLAPVLLPSNLLPHPAELREHLSVFTRHYLKNFHFDIHLFETYVLPLTRTIPEARSFRDLIVRLKNIDYEPRAVKFRS